ncbi:DUF2272 domain-containing protein [Methylobacter psychrophilus]|uniref:DUF2272 domain-containing protein n=1 Tax=Methylobacter psychrophilus TaxID=96941 RepID=UPI0021D4FE49|nr:DUF2272 domain-containing protein [Methylobacter psychrophilus]
MSIETVGFTDYLNMPYLLLSMVLLITGCTLQKQAQAPAILAATNTPPTFIIPAIRERMLYLARQEWELFGRPEVNYDSEPPTITYPDKVTHGHETLPPFFSRIFMYWYRATDLPIIGYDGEIRPWSGAFIVWLARSAGVPESDFPSTVLHWDYIQYVLSAGSKNSFVSHPVNAYAPKPGDIICAPRGEEFIQSIHSYKDLKRGAYHCDLVVEKRLGELDVIGGNVLDAVSLAHIKLDGAGKVLRTKARPWSLVIEQRN